MLGFDPHMVMTYKDSALRKEVALEAVKASSEEEALGDAVKRPVFLKWMNPAQTPMTKIEAALPSSQYERDEHRRAVVDNIVENWTTLSVGGKFHAILATSSIPEAIEYYKILRDDHAELKVTALFDPSIDNTGGSTVKEDALLEILQDYNSRYGMTFSMPTWDNFKKDVANRLAHKEAYIGVENTPEKQIDILIVVDQMLTGFDSKWLNTLYLDKMRDEENLIQAFSRTNRLFGPEKPFGSIRYYRKPHTMTKNIDDAIKLYSGERPFALYVEHLEDNLNGMNQTYAEIKTVFTDAGIGDFERLPSDMAACGQFAMLFKRFNDYLNAAKIQGFRWKEAVYPFSHEGADDTLVTMVLDERVYGILVQRYKELASGGGGSGSVGGGSVVPFDIEPYITEIDIGLINADYMESKFKKFVKSLEQKNVTEQELAAIKEELHKTFSALSQDDQKFAEMLLDDIAHGNIVLQSGMTLQDYITQYKTKALNEDIDLAVSAFGLDRTLLIEILSHGKVTEGNLNEFGRFDKLVETVDNAKAKSYLEEALGMHLNQIGYRTRITAVLEEFLLSGGKGEKIPKIESAMDDDETPQMLLAAEGEPTEA